MNNNNIPKTEATSTETLSKFITIYNNYIEHNYIKNSIYQHMQISSEISLLQLKLVLPEILLFFCSFIYFFFGIFLLKSDTENLTLNLKQKKKNFIEDITKHFKLWLINQKYTKKLTFSEYFFWLLFIITIITPLYITDSLHRRVGIMLFSNSCIIDTYSQTIKSIILIISFVITLIIHEYLKKNKNFTFDYLFFFLMAIISSILLISTFELFVGLMLVETLNICLYLLITFKTKSQNACEAGLNYLLISIFSGVFLTLSILFMYIGIGTSNFYLLKNKIYSIFHLYTWLPKGEQKPWTETYTNYFRSTPDWTLFNFIDNFIKNGIDTGKLQLSNLNYKIPLVIDTDFKFNSYFFAAATILLLMFFLIKLGIAPFHIWVPKVYKGTNLPAVLILSTLIKFVYLSFFLRILNYVYLYVHENLKNFLLLFILLTFIFGALGALIQKEIKTFIAFSSMQQFSYIMLAIISDCQQISLDTPINMFLIGQYHLGAESAYIYFIFYIIANLVIFGCIILYFEKESKKNLQYISDLKIIIWKDPIIAFMLIVAFLSLSGAPPFIGFFTKYSLLLVYLKKGLFYSFWIVICTSLISFFYYWRIIKTILFSYSAESISEESIYKLVRSYAKNTISPKLYTIISIFTVILIFYPFVYSHDIDITSTDKTNFNFFLNCEIHLRKSIASVSHPFTDFKYVEQNLLNDIKLNKEIQKVEQLHNHVKHIHDNNYLKKR